ncbi:hypothetical protein BST83_03255 [Polaribacter filamentus]|uniref:Uncharacterized protein n=1 Tax=Polaribacter filamentus TaxID=53483 RepID=A0A2S7KUN3_9FLAO|nr:hypothetical protein BST83_03255 [Polaribacter filamentus]
MLQRFRNISSQKSLYIAKAIEKQQAKHHFFIYPTMTLYLNLFFITFIIITINILKTKIL